MSLTNARLLVGEDIFRMQDADGDEGEYQITVEILRSISPEKARDYGAPRAGMDLVIVTSDYSPWPKYSAYRSLMIGYEVSDPWSQPDDTDERIVVRFAMPDGELRLFLLRMKVWIDGVRPWGQIDWRRGSIFYSILDFDPRGSDAEIGSVKRALRNLTLLRPLPGGRPKGRTKGQKLSRREILEWYREASDGYACDGSEPRLKDLGEFMGVSADTASTRIREAGLHWPPTPDELDELSAE